MSRFMGTLVLGIAVVTNVFSQTNTQCATLASCPADGCGARRDPDLNIQKNRTGKPSQVKAVSFADFVGFNSQSVNKKMRSSWTETERATIAGIEGGPGVTLTAYLFDATLADPETCNCFKPTQANRDFHIWLAEDKAGAKKKKFVVVEITPRIRKDHSSWTLAAIRKLKPKSGKPWTLVRVTGYPLFDNEHWDFPKRKIRATAWEIHPITEFSYCATGDTCNPSSDQGWTTLGQ